MNIIAFVVSFIVFIGGIVMMGYSFGADVAGPGFLFMGGILAISVGVAIPVHVLKRVDR